MLDPLWTSTFRLHDQMIRRHVGSVMNQCVQVAWSDEKTPCWIRYEPVGSGFVIRWPKQTYMYTNSVLLFHIMIMECMHRMLVYMMMNLFSWYRPVVMYTKGAQKLTIDEVGQRLPKNQYRYELFHSIYTKWLSWEKYAGLF